MRGEMIRERGEDGLEQGGDGEIRGEKEIIGEGGKRR